MLIIKSQFNTFIGEVNQVFIAVDENSIETNVNGIDLVLGAYKTRERAQEVFDQICIEISAGTGRDSMKFANKKDMQSINYRVFQPKVFNMPLK